MEVLPRPSWDTINRQWIKQAYTQPFTINGIFSRQAPNSGEGQVPSYAGAFSKTVTSNGVDTHYYANGYLSVQPSGYATWYTYGAGVPLPTIPGATVPSGTVPGNTVFGLGSPLALPKNNSAPSGIALFVPAVYKLGETVSFTQANTSVYDPDGVSDLSKLEFWLKAEGGNWEYNGAVRNFIPDIIDDTQGSFNYDLSNLAGGKYQLQMKLTDWSGASIDEYWSFTVVQPNKAPENLQFNLTKSSYSVGETVRLDAKVFDINGASDISKVEFYYKQNGSNWQYLGKNESFIPDANWANFYLNITDAPAANYEVMATAYDRAGLASNTVTGAFQVTAPFDNNATQWFSNGKTLSGDMLAEYNRLVSQGNYLGNPSFVDTSPAKSYFGTDVQRAFFPSQNLGYTSIYKSQYGTFSLSGSIADYYTNYYFRKYDDPSGKNPYLPDGLFGIYAGLGVPISSVIRQADGSEVAYFEGGMLTNRYGVVTPTYYQKDRFDLVGQNAPSGTELQWKNDYSYWNWKSVGQPTSSVRRINNGWIQEFTGSIDSAGDSIFLLKDGQSVEGGNDLNNIPNGGPYRVQGEILKAYRSVGGQDGVLGFPVISQERAVNGYKAYLEFENGSIGIDFNDRTIIKDKLGRNIWPNISANHWNARFINRNQWNVADYSTYDYDFNNNPAAVVDLGYQNNGNGLISLNKDFGEGSPTTGVQNDNFAMLAWTRTYLEAGKTYKITTQSDDGTFFKLKNVRTNEWFNPGGDWRDRSATEPAKTVQFKVNESGEYDFHIQYYDKTGFSIINVNLEETQQFPTNPQPQTSIWSEKVNGVLDGLNGEFQIRDPYGNWPGQCVSFVKRFTQSLGVNMNPMGGDGGARNGFINFNKPGLSLSSAQADNIVFTGNEQPQVGDIIFFDKTSTNPYGHVAVVQSVLGDGRVIIEQSNGDNKALSTGTYVTRDEINLNANPPRRGFGSVMGWLRLKNAESASSGSGSSGGGFASGGGNPIGGGSPSGGGDPGGSYNPIPSTVPSPVVSIDSVSSIGIRGKSIDISGKSNTTDMEFYIGNRKVNTTVFYNPNGAFSAQLNIPDDKDMPLGNYQVKVVGKNQLGQTHTFSSNSTINVVVADDRRQHYIGKTNGGTDRNVVFKRIDSPGYIENKPTWIVIHGWNGNASDSEDLATAIDKYDSKYQVLTLDWDAARNVGLDVASAWIETVAQSTANILQSLWGIASSQINLAGHSLGAYVSYEISKDLGGINKLVALAPASTTVGTYTNRPNVDFSRYSQWSWAFYGNPLTDSAEQARTADESFEVDFDFSNPDDSHGASRTLWTNMLKDKNGPISKYFGLEDMNSQGKPWFIDTSGLSSQWEAKIWAYDANGFGAWNSNWVPYRLEPRSKVAI